MGGIRVTRCATRMGPRSSGWATARMKATGHQREVTPQAMEPVATCCFENFWQQSRIHTEAGDERQSMRPAGRAWIPSVAPWPLCPPLPTSAIDDLQCPAVLRCVEVLCKLYTGWVSSCHTTLAARGVVQTAGAGRVWLNAGFGSGGFMHHHRAQGRQKRKSLKSQPQNGRGSGARVAPSQERLGGSYLIWVSLLAKMIRCWGDWAMVPGLAQLFRKQFWPIPTRKL